MKDFIKQKKILVVDDEEELLKLLEVILKKEGFEKVILAKSMQEGICLAKKYQPDLAILDIMLGDGNGFALMAALRAESEIPVIFLSAKDEAQSKLTGLGLGADDYIAKPFLPQELILRLKAVLRRCYSQNARQVVLENCLLDFEQALVIWPHKNVPLTAMEFRLLETLAQNEGRIVTVDTICEKLWGSHAFGYENSLNAHIRRIREKIEVDPSKPISLLTIKGLGYKLSGKKERKS